MLLLHVKHAREAPHRYISGGARLRLGCSWRRTPQALHLQPMCWGPPPAHLPPSSPTCPTPLGAQGVQALVDQAAMRSRVFGHTWPEQAPPPPPPRAASAPQARGQPPPPPPPKAPAAAAPHGEQPLLRAAAPVRWRMRGAAWDVHTHAHTHTQNTHARTRRCPPLQCATACIARCHLRLSPPTRSRTPTRAWSATCWTNHRHPTTQRPRGARRAPPPSPERVRAHARATRLVC